MGAVGNELAPAEHEGRTNQTSAVYPKLAVGSTPAIQEQLAWLSRHIEALDLGAATEESLTAFRTLLGQMMGKIDTERQRRDSEGFRTAMDQGEFDPVYLPKPWERGR